MSSPADEVINVLRAEHESLVASLAPLSATELEGPSGASEWSIAQVLSHLGSGADITLAGLDVALTGVDHRSEGFNQSVWDRWNAKSPSEQAADFIKADEELVARYESIDADTRASLRIDLGFLPAPVDLATAAGLRLNEAALHGWDVRVAIDPAATLGAATAGQLIDRAGLLLGWISKPDAIGDRSATINVATTEPDRAFGVRITDKVELIDAAADADAVLTAPAEAWLRLTAGRLAPAHTPTGVVLSAGPITLDELRRVFPGF